MDGLHSDAQNAVQGVSAKEISEEVGEAVEQVIGFIGDLFEQDPNKNKESAADNVTASTASSVELSQKLGKTSTKLGQTVKTAVTAPVEAVKLTVEIIKLTKDFVRAKSSETIDDLQVKFRAGLGKGKDLLNDLQLKLGSGLSKAKEITKSIKNFLFDRTNGKVNIKEEVRGNRAEQAKKFIDLLKTEAGEQAPHDFHNVEIKSEGIKLLEVKDGLVELNEIAKQMNSEIVQTAMTQNTIPAVLSPNLANVDSDSLTGQILADQQLVEINGEGLDPILADELDRLLVQAENQAAAIDRVNANSELATDTSALIAENRRGLENLVQMHKLAANEKGKLILDGSDRVTVTIQAATGENLQYNVATKGDRSYSFITNKDGQVITYDADITSVAPLLDSAAVAFNPELDSQFTVGQFSKNSRTNALHQFSHELATMPEGEQSVTIGEQAYQVTKDAAQVTVTTSDDSQLTIQADGKVSSSGTVMNELFEGGKSSISTKLIAKIQAENNEVKEILSRERGAMNQGDLDRAEGLGKAAKTELSEVKGLNANLDRVAKTEAIVEPTTVRPERVFDLVEEVEAKETKVEAQTQSQVIITNSQLKDLRDDRRDDIKDVLYASLGKNDKFGSRIEKMQDAADKFITNDEYAALEAFETKNVDMLVSRLEQNIQSEEVAIPEFAAHLEENPSLLAADQKESLANIQSRTESLTDAKVLLEYIQNKYISKDGTQEVADRSTGSKYILIEESKEELVADRHAEISRAIAPRDRKLTAQARASNLNTIINNPRYQGIKSDKQTIIGVVEEDIKIRKQNRGVLSKNLETKNVELNEARKVSDSPDEQYLLVEIDRLTKFVESDDRELETLSQLKEYIESSQFQEVLTSPTISSPITISLASLNESSETDKETSNYTSTAPKAGSLASLNDSDENEAITSVQMQQEPELEMAN
jgi:hypothetical protein